MLKRVEKNWKKVGSEVFILDGAEEKTHSLNETAGWVWMTLAQECSFEALFRSFLDDFEVGEDTARRDLQELVKQLVEKGLIQQYE